MAKVHEHIKKHLVRVQDHVRDHFIGHEGNNFHPHLFQHRVLFGYSVILILIKVIVIVGPVALPSSSLYSSAVNAKNIIDLTNQTRINLALSPLAANQLLIKAAEAKAQDMLKRQYFAHQSPDGVAPWDWIKTTGYKYRLAGENLAVHFHEAEDVTAGWMASPSHRANIVNNNYREIGVGTATGVFEGVEATFVVQMFGTPVNAAVAMANVNQLNAPSGSTTNIETSAGSVAGSKAEPGGNLSSAPTPTTSIQPTVYIDENTVMIRPTTSSYLIKIRVQNAQSVSAVYSSDEIALRQSDIDDVWYGEIPMRAGVGSETGEQITVVAKGLDGSLKTLPIALLAPRVDTQKFYNFNEGIDKFTSFFGFLRIGNLNDEVRRFYLGFIVFLAGVLLVNMFVVRLKMRHPSVVTHAMAVLILAVVLYAV